jgi:hypothetical protein
MRIRGQQADAGEAAGDQAAQEGEPGGAVLAGDDIEAERLTEAVSIAGDGLHDAGVDRSTALAALDLERIQDEVRVGPALERAGAEVGDDRIQRLGEPRDLALAHPLDAELPDELLHPPRGDAGQVGVGDHRHERLLGAPARLQQPIGEVRALPQLRDRELDRADARPVRGSRCGC